MRKLYVFAVGGTGSRVLKSLTMLLAAGVKADTNDPFEIVPVIIDPHSGNLDFQRTNRLLENYMAITKEIGIGNGFFATGIKTLHDLNPKASKLPSNFTYGLKEVYGALFKSYIGYARMNEANQSLAQVLFSGKTIDRRNREVDLLDIEMDIGFIGNPNIGSVVLNQFKGSNEFMEFASSFDKHDRVLIVSSIFGGTGAAGFPIIVKNIRNAMGQSEINGKGFLRDAKLGAISVLPYFNVAPDPKSPIQKSEFIAKTKAALSYYQTNMHGAIDVLYYLSDDLSGKAYKNDPGNGGQENQAHFIELAAATAVFDFMDINDDRFSAINGVVQRPVYKEFGVQTKAADMQFADLEDMTRDKIRRHMAQLLLFKKYLDEHFRDAIGKHPWSIQEPRIDHFLTDSSFFSTHLDEFLKSYADWLNEMSDNGRAFSPFLPGESLKAFIKNHHAHLPWYFFGRFKYKSIDKSLNLQNNKGKYTNGKDKLVRLFYDATGHAMQKFYKLNS